MTPSIRNTSSEVSRSSIRYFLYICTSLLQIGIAQQLPFKFLTARDGLISNSTTALVQDTKGFIWIGSYDGYSRYDGYSFMNRTIAEGLPGNYITCFAESNTRNGRMFIGTYGRGIADLENDVMNVLHAGSDIILSLKEDHRGSLWCGTDNEVIRFDPGSSQPKTFLSGCGTVQSITETDDSLLWIMTKKNGLICLNISTNSPIRVGIPAIDRFDPILISQQHQRTIWMADRSGNFISVRGTTIVTSVTTNHPDFHALSIVCIDPSTFWIGTIRGIRKLQVSGPERYESTFYSEQNGLPEQTVLPVLLDHENNLWSRSFSKGLVILSDESVRTFPLTPAPMVMNNASVAVTENGTVWMTSSGGLHELRQTGNGSSEQYLHPSPDEAKYGFANALLYDPPGRLWIKYWHGAIIQYSILRRSGKASTLVKRKEYAPGKEFPKGAYSCFAVDRRGNIFYGIDEFGVIVIPSASGGRVSRVDTVDGLSGDRIRVLSVDADGRLWCGGTGSRLYRIGTTGGKYSAERITADSAFGGHTIRSLNEDDDHALWVGTSTGDIAMIRNDSIIMMPQEPLLKYNNIWAFAGDSDRLWIGTSKGLLLMDKKNGRISVPSGTIRGSAVYSCRVTADRTIAAVSEEGGHLFDPSLMSVSKSDPPISITSFMVNGVEQRNNAFHELGPDQNNCTIEFLALAYKDHRSLQYSYQLKPIDSEWQQLRAQRAVTFAALPAGNYEFSVKAVTLRGDESSQSASIAFTILPPVWQRWWFISGTLLLAGMLISFAYRYRVNRLLEVERIRSRIAMDLHDEIGSTLGGISVLSELLKKEEPQPNENALHMLNRIGISSRQMMESMSDIVWALNPQNDSMEQFISRIRTVAGEIFEPRGIEYRVTVPESLSVDLPMEPRRQLYLIIKEALHNSAKHSHCTSAAVELSVDGDVLSVRMSDNGKGFSAGEQHSGNGLKNMKARAAQISAEVSVTSSAERGTSITVNYHIT